MYGDLSHLLDKLDQLENSWKDDIGKKFYDLHIDLNSNTYRRTWMQDKVSEYSEAKNTLDDTLNRIINRLDNL